MLLHCLLKFSDCHGKLNIYGGAAKISLCRNACSGFTVGDPQVSTLTFDMETKIPRCWVQNMSISSIDVFVGEAGCPLVLAEKKTGDSLHLHEHAKNTFVFKMFKDNQI